jgi:hypothetical protein
MRYMHLRLTRKPSDTIQGIDLSRSRVGDIVVVTPHSAARLIAEGCAEETHVSQFLESRVVYPPSRAAAS